MESSTRIVESLFEKAVDYGAISYRLAKLKTLSKTSNVFSSMFVHLIVLIFALSFLLFLCLGLAIWIGEVLGNNFQGFFLVGTFFGLTALFTHFFLHKRIKKMFANYFIEQILK